jgi:hypothetical protein
LTALDILMDDRFNRDMQQWLLRTSSFGVQLHRLHIMLPPPHDTPLDLSGLLKLTQLKQLAIGDIQLDSDQLAVLRDMASLGLLSASGMKWTPEQLELLCRPPHKLQRLHTLATRYLELTEAHCVELMNLPALSSLSFASLTADAASMLSHFPALRVLDFCSGPLASTLAIDGLRACSSLTDLTLQTTFSVDKNRQLLSPLRSLRKLALVKLAVTDLSFFVLPPRLSLFPQQLAPVMLPALTSLTLRGCRNLATVQLRHVFSLPALRQLLIIDSFVHPLDGLARHTLQPPSGIIPQLESFTCEDSRPLPE